MSLPPSIFNNEDGGIDNPFDDGENTPMWAMIPERQVPTSKLAITFNDTSLGSPNASKRANRVITTKDSQHLVNWFPANDTVQVQRVVWQVAPDQNQPDELVDILDSNNSSTSDKRSSPTGMTYAIGSNKVNLPVFQVDSKMAQWNALEMYLTLHWNVEGGRSGTTRSGVFTVSNADVDSGEYNGIVQSYDLKIQQDSKKKDGIETDSGSEPSSNGNATPSPGSQSTATASSPGLGSLPTVGSSDNNSSGGGGGGLPTGAIAGIVVGAVLGLAIIAFLAWFFLRRRRRASNVSSGPGHGPHDYLADKETQARVTESPHSPYTDDGQHPPQQQFHAHNDQDAVLPASATSPTDRRSFAPYEEHTPIASRSVDNVNRDGARSSTPNVNSNVSHLIEDGMTEDEIRRLEEEERALDAAIEQAGQGQSGGRGQQRR